MNINDIKRDVYSGIISKCEISCEGKWFTLEYYCVYNQKWQLLLRERSGVRLFKNANAAMMIAAELGFNEVTLIQPTQEH
ncbi:MAG: hypothetical protein HRU05_15940 [Oceanospirillaceae bacterium]|nr:hypothetical protein [Oceanospirillaceae bacterium]